LNLPPLSISSMGAAVLAGGRGARFGGDKPLARFRGTTLLEYLLQQLSALNFAQTIVSAKDPDRLRTALGAAASTIELIADESPDFNPLYGLRAALQFAKTEWLFICAADMPFAADRDLIEALAAASEDQSAVAAIHENQLQPLCAIWNRARVLPICDSLIRDGHGGPRKLLKLLNAKSIDWKDPRPFLDADTRGALAALEN
jgi:molybdopterin-guanine dinucleotide biosynthesis protein